MSFNVSSIIRKLSKPTSFFGVELWVAILICIILFVLSFALGITLYVISTRRRRKARNTSKPTISKDLHTNSHNNYSMSRRLLPHNGWEIEMGNGTPEKQVIFSSKASGPLSSGMDLELAARYPHPPVAFDIRASCQFTLSEIEAATDDFADENVVACGDYAIVYYGILFGNTRVTIKRLLSSRLIRAQFTIDLMLIREH